MGRSPAKKQSVMVRQAGKRAGTAAAAREQGRWTGVVNSPVCPPLPPTSSHFSEGAGPGTGEWSGTCSSSACLPTCLAHHTALPSLWIVSCTPDYLPLPPAVPLAWGRGGSILDFLKYNMVTPIMHQKLMTRCKYDQGRKIYLYIFMLRPCDNEMKLLADYIHILKWVM